MSTRSSPGAVIGAALAAVAPLAALFAFVCVAHVLAPDDLSGWKPANEALMTGLIRGLMISLLAVGIGLIYRTNRIVNFAQAELGAPVGQFVIALMIVHHWNYWIAFPLGLAGAVLSGIIIEFVIVRRFFKAPRLILTVATIGIVQALVALGAFIQIWMDSGQARSPFFDPPISWTFTVGLQRFDGHDAWALIVAPVVLVMVGAFLRYSPIGIALRGAAESADRAALLGIPVRGLQTVVWAIASALAFITYFLNAGLIGRPRVGSISQDILLIALGAAVIGRLDRLPTIVCASIGFGFVDEAIKRDWGEEAYRAAAIALILIVAVMLLRDRRANRVAAGSISTWQSVTEVRGIPRELSGERPVVIARAAMLVAIAAAVLLVPVVFSGTGQVRLAGAIGIFAIVGLSMVILTGWAGHVSLGQMSIVGIGAAAGGSTTTLNDQDLVVGLLAGGLVGAAVMVLIGLPALKARGISLGITTLAFSFATYQYLLNDQFAPGFIKERLPTFEGDAGLFRPTLLWNLNVDNERTYYYFIVACLFLAVLATRGLRKSRTGRAIISLRENERAGQSYGVPTRTTFVTALAASGFLAGFAGSLFVHQQKALDASNFQPTAGLFLFAIVVVGGLGSIGGSVLGAIYVLGVDYFLPGEWSFLAQAFGLLLVLLFFPGGLGAMVGQVRDWALRAYANRRGIRVPSLIADTRVEPDFVASPAMAEAVADATEREAEVEALR
jgi:branched-chain amino acid transport system permease protein